MKKTDVGSLQERPSSGTRKRIVSYEPRKWDPSWNDELRFVEKYGLRGTKYRFRIGRTLALCCELKA